MASSFISKVSINTCNKSDLLKLPGIGPKIAQRIMTIRSTGMHLTAESLSSIPYVKTTPELMGLIDFSKPCPPLDDIPQWSEFDPPQKSKTQTDTFLADTGLAQGNTPPYNVTGEQTTGLELVKYEVPDQSSTKPDPKLVFLHKPDSSWFDEYEHKPDVHMLSTSTHSGQPGDASPSPSQNITQGGQLLNLTTDQQHEMSTDELSNLSLNPAMSDPHGGAIPKKTKPYQQQQGTQHDNTYLQQGIQQHTNTYLQQGNTQHDITYQQQGKQQKDNSYQQHGSQQQDNNNCQQQGNKQQQQGDNKQHLYVPNPQQGGGQQQGSHNYQEHQGIHYQQHGNPTPQFSGGQQHYGSDNYLQQSGTHYYQQGNDHQQQTPPYHNYGSGQQQHGSSYQQQGSAYHQQGMTHPQQPNSCHQQQIYQQQTLNTTQQQFNQQQGYNNPNANLYQQHGAYPPPTQNYYGRQHAPRFDYNPNIPPPSQGHNMTPGVQPYVTPPVAPQGQQLPDNTQQFRHTPNQQGAAAPHRDHDVHSDAPSTPWRPLNLTHRGYESDTSQMSDQRHSPYEDHRRQHPNRAGQRTPQGNRGGPRHDNPDLDTDAEDQDFEPRRPNRRDQQNQREAQNNQARFIASAPKSLKYGGKTNWKAFYTKFSGYARAAGWSDDQKLSQLCWCLEEKAIDFYTLLVDQDPNINFQSVISKMEKRFGFQELPETVQVQFQTSVQNQNESLEDWADRVLSLATKAFRELPEEHMTRQAIMKFCRV